MTKYFFRSKRCAFSVLGVVASVIILFASCVKVDDSLGVDYIPNDQLMGIKIDSTFEVKTYNITTDSINSSNQSVNFIGAFLSSNTGNLDAEMLIQFTKPYFPNDSLFGVTPVCDSLFLQLAITRTMGRKDVEQTFDVYELEKRIYIDSVYYSDFDPTPFIKKTPMFSFTADGEVDVIRHEIKDAEFIKRLLDTTGYGYPYDSLFKKRFPGFYIKPRESKKDAAIYSVDISSSSIILNYRNNNPDKKDTTYAMYSFAPTSQYNYTGNQSVNIMKYDYANVSPELRLNDKTVPVPITYIQGYGGIATYLEFPKESVENIRAKVKANGFTDIVINKAKLEIAFPNRTADDMDNSYGRLGMYLDMKKFGAIPDYAYTMESQGYTIPYGGYINRSRYMYEMDITMYVQRLFREDYDKRGVTLAPSMEYMYQIDPMQLSGFGSGDPIRLIITYTMVR